jgi:hypothetical protein
MCHPILMQVTFECEGLLDRRDSLEEEGVANLDG